MKNLFVKEEFRILWADIAKGIGIILVIMGHTPIPCNISEYFGVPNFLQNWIYSFHMPFFFLMSGFLTNWKYSYLSFVLRKVRTILIFYVIYSTINILLGFGTHQFMLVIKHGWGGQALWFLPVLFSSLVAAKIFPDKFIILGIFIMSFISWILACNNIHIRWALSSVPYAVVWVLIGRLSPKYINYIMQESWKKHIVYFICMFVCVSTIAYFCRLNMCSNKILPLIPLIVSGISGTILVIIISKYISKLKLINTGLMYMGRNSLEIMAFHQSIIYFIPVPLSIKILLLPTIITFVVILKRKILTLIKT